MISRIRKLLILVVTCIPFVATAATWQNRNVAQLQSTYVLADCIYFQLVGVTQADPVLPGSPWFAVPRSQYGSKDAYAMLLASKVSGVPLTVYTNGTTACGYALASEIKLE